MRRCTNETAAEWATCADTPRRHWHFGAAAAACGARRYSAADARALLAGRRLVFAGDSISRHLYGATLRLLGEPGERRWPASDAAVLPPPKLVRAFLLLRSALLTAAAAAAAEQARK